MRELEKKIPVNTGLARVILAEFSAQQQVLWIHRCLRKRFTAVRLGEIHSESVSFSRRYVSANTFVSTPTFHTPFSNVSVISRISFTRYRVNKWVCKHDRGVVAGSYDLCLRENQKFYDFIHSWFEQTQKRYAGNKYAEHLNSCFSVWSSKCHGIFIFFAFFRSYVNYVSNDRRLRTANRARPVYTIFGIQFLRLIKVKSNAGVKTNRCSVQKYHDCTLLEQFESIIYVFGSNWVIRRVEFKICV